MKLCQANLVRIIFGLKLFNRFAFSTLTIKDITDILCENQLSSSFFYKLLHFFHYSLKMFYL
ncbi:hypothetical protein HZS_6484 [Henneguya salminicola]|nr:hypothetical protein HZS_6484 [Henneguya salminicola]